MDNTKTQAERIAAKFGGVPNLRKALAAAFPERRWSVSGIYKWNLPRKKASGVSYGGNGLIPSSTLPYVLAAARREGIVITAEDLYPVERKA